jgi:NAD(P)-dependent dehydrogenase (short-subunit alcohol dehydrogenase family)
MGEFTGKIAIVTGGTRGIGAAIAAKLLAEGASVVVTGRKQAVVEAAAAELDPSGERCVGIAAHNGEVASLEALLQATLARFGRVDLLVNNAATNPHFGPILTCDEGAWDKIFGVDLKGYFFLSRMVADHLIERKAAGSIVNISSIVGLRPDFAIGVYGIAKAGVVALTKTAAQEWGTFGIRVNAVAPGVIPTRLSQMIVETPEIHDEVVRKTPLGRLGTVDEVAEAVAWLLSERAGYTTGHVLTVDGGTVLY